MLTGSGFLVLFLWLGLLFGRGDFWRMREDDATGPPGPARWPAVTAVVPARDEADVIAESLGSLLDQDYPGPFHIILVDDGSTDGTGDIARALAAARFSGRLRVLQGAPLPSGWTGKLWALSQGIAAAGDTPKYLLLTDADIVHDPDSVRSLVARAEAGNLAMASLMAKLHCESLAERATIPAFIYFFQMLYPFRLVNGPGRKAAAAGGCLLANRTALERAGGIASVKGALIDDCAMGARLKMQGPIWLGLTERVRSIRRYETMQPVAQMVTRSAYAQLRYSPLILAGTLAGMVVTFLAPPILEIGFGDPAALLAWILMTVSFVPVTRRYGVSPSWSLALPLIALLYSLWTVRSALAHWRGRGGYWKGRVQAAR
ncbi:MAG: glycosyltransferase [Hyphomicrobiales bacterium]